MLKMLQEMQVQNVQVLKAVTCGNETILHVVGKSAYGVQEKGEVTLKTATTIHAGTWVPGMSILSSR